jgi:hypothetical protein
MKVSELKVAEKIKVGTIGNGEPIAWLVGAHGHYQKGHTVIITENTLGNITFSPANPIDKIGDRRLFGNNRYFDSYVRKYLNNDFLKMVFTPGEIAAIAPTAIKAIRPQVDISGDEKTDAMIDWLFFLSTAETGLEEENEEGRIIKLFRKASFRRALDINGAADWWWLRTPYASNSYNVRVVGTTGALANYSAYYGSRGLRPACNLVSNHLVSEPDNEGCYGLITDEVDYHG